MLARIAPIRRTAQEGSEAVYVWGMDYEACAEEVRGAGTPVLMLDSGGFCAEWNDTLRELVMAGRFRISHEVLPWEVIAWRETGRELFKDTIVDQEEQAHAMEAAWGTDDNEVPYEEGLTDAINATARRLRIARADDVLSMCTWRVFDRQRGILSARYGLGSLDSDEEINTVLDAIGVQGDERSRLYQLWIASQAWW